MYVSMSPSDFHDLEAKAKAASNIVSVKTTSDNSGLMETSDVSFEYFYDYSKQLLFLTIGKRHSLAAKMATDNIIFRHLADVISTLEPLVHPVSDQEAENAPVVDAHGGENIVPEGIPQPGLDISEPPFTEGPPPLNIKPIKPKEEGV